MWFVAVPNNICTLISFSAYITLTRSSNTVGVGQKQGSTPQPDIVNIPDDVQF